MFEVPQTSRREQCPTCNRLTKRQQFHEISWETAADSNIIEYLADIFLVLVLASGQPVKGNQTKYLLFNSARNQTVTVTPSSGCPHL